MCVSFIYQFTIIFTKKQVNKGGNVHFLLFFVNFLIFYGGFHKNKFVLCKVGEKNVFAYMQR